MNKRWWLAIAGLLIGAAGFAQNTSQPPYRPIPPQNYRVAPQRPPMEGARWHKNGLFNPQQFFEQLRNQVRPTRAPNWDRDLTVAPTDDIHPVYFPGQARAFFASNATAVVNGRLANPGPRYRIWRGDMDDGSTPNQGLFTNLTQITGDTPDEQFGSQIQPSLNQQGNILAYANLTASGNYNIVVRNLSTGQRIVLTTDTDGVTQNLRPTLSPGGNLVAFASNRLEPGETEADRRFRIYVMRTDGRPFDDGTIYRRYTFPDPGENDLEPAWSPDGRLIAFARTFPDGSSYIHVVDADTRIVTQWTSFVDGSGNRPQDRQPAWDRTEDGTLVLVFASTRKSLDNQGRHQRGQPSNSVSTDNIFDIYAVAADLPEDSGRQVLKKRKSVFWRANIFCIAKAQYRKSDEREEDQQQGHYYILAVSPGCKMAEIQPNEKVNERNKEQDNPPDRFSYNLQPNDQVVNRDDGGPARFTGLLKHFPKAYND